MSELKELDHFDLLVEISGELKSIAARVSTIVDSLNMAEISEARNILASELAGVEAMKNVVRSKLSIMNQEWEQEVNKADKAIKERLIKSTKRVQSLEDFI